MNKIVITKCGYRCDLCLAYKENVERNDERQKLSDGWFKIYGFRIPAEEIICEGCVSGEDPDLIDKGCPVRPCAISKRLSNCAECEDYICERLSSRIVDKNALEVKSGHKFTEEDYIDFILPYESRPRLKMLRREHLARRKDASK